MSYCKKAAFMPNCGNIKPADSCKTNNMEFNYFSHNGKILPVAEARMELADIQYQYGFGVYETIRISSGSALFLHDHSERLLESARIIGLEHPFDAVFFERSIQELIV